MTNISQYPDSSGNPAYAYTHWKAIDGEIDVIPLMDENGERHELRYDSNDGIVIDDNPIFKPEDYYTADEIDELLKLASPDGTVWVMSIDNNGMVSWVKEDAE